MWIYTVHNRHAAIEERPCQIVDSAQFVLNGRVTISALKLIIT